MLCRDNQIFKRGILPALVLTALFAVICTAVGLVSYRDTKDGGEAVKVALVDEEDSILSRICISLIEEQSYMKKLLSIRSVDREKQALRMLSDGECAAVIILPEGYLDDLMGGIPCQGRIVLSEEAASSAELVRAVTQAGELLIAAGQEAVFSGERIIAEHGLGSDVHSEYLDTVNMELIRFAKEVYDGGFTEDAGAYAQTGLSVEAHFASGWLALLMFVSGLFFEKLYTMDVRRPLLQRLLASGVTPWEFMAGKLLFPGIFRVILLGAILALLNRFVPVSVTPISLVCLLTAILSSTVTVSCTAVFFAGRGNWQGIILSVSALGLFLVGGIGPRGMLPDTLTAIGDFTPLGSVRAWLMPVFGGKLHPSAAISAVYAGALLALCVRRLRCEPEKGGGL